MLAVILPGLYMLVSRRLFGFGYGPSMLSAHTHVILVGFMAMMIMDVSIRFFPRAEKTDKHYSPAQV